MWPKKYRDYQKDDSLVKQKVEPGNGIVGCEMHEKNGWGETLHHYKRKKNIIERFFDLFSKKKEQK